MSAFGDFNDAINGKKIDEETKESMRHDIMAMSFYIASVLLIKRAIHEGDVEIVAYTIGRVLSEFEAIAVNKKPHNY